MQRRISRAKIAPEGYKTLVGMETYICQCGLDQRLIELAKMRRRRSMVAIAPTCKAGVHGGQAVASSGYISRRFWHEAALTRCANVRR